MNRPNFYHFLPARNPLQSLRSSHCQNFQIIIFTGQRLEKYVNCQNVFLVVFFMFLIVLITEI